MDEQARTALVTWLCGPQFDWHYFFTATFSFPRNPHWAESSVEQARALLQQHHPGHMFIGVEFHTLGTLHLHGLLEKPALTYVGPIAYDRSEGVRQQTWRHLFRRFGRADVQYVRKLRSTANYCAKYVTKEMAYYNIW